uniref:histidine kinase n=1 Tax=Phenylobacterium glaciei TaxID=2803784 RepID=A0A974P1Y2_9CAUL|nr:sensor histidine kinase [Phenylobacterium glaciei]
MGGRRRRGAAAGDLRQRTRVPEVAWERLFDRFYRLEHSRSTPGNGLGLALVAAIAKLHGADVELADARPGLTVRVTFPGLPEQAGGTLGHANLLDIGVSAARC